MNEGTSTYWYPFPLLVRIGLIDQCASTPGVHLTSQYDGNPSLMTATSDIPLQVLMIA